MRPAYFVPESKRLDDLLRELQQQHVHMAIVIDEYGSVSGLVTIEDLVEEIIGDIQDEYDREEQLLEQVSDNEYLVDAKISLDELNEELGINLTSEDYDTLGGLVYGHLDKIPTVGDVGDAGGFIMTVMSTRGRRVTKVRLVRQGQQPGTGSEEVHAEVARISRRGGRRPTAAPTRRPPAGKLPILRENDDKTRGILTCRSRIGRTDPRGSGSRPLDAIVTWKRRAHESSFTSCCAADPELSRQILPIDSFYEMSYSDQSIVCTCTRLQARVLSPPVQPGPKLVRLHRFL